MKKVLSIVLALALVFGFASMTLAMGPDGPAPANVGFVLTSFNVSDSVLSPLQIMNWSGSLQPTKTYAEGQPIWFIASYVQNKFDGDDGRNFMSLTTAGTLSVAPYLNAVTTVFTSKDLCLNYSFSKAYMNFVKIDGLQVSGGTVQSTVNANADVSASVQQLEVKFAAAAFHTAAADPTMLEVEETYPSNTGIAGYGGATHAASSAKSYYLQIMAFTNACSEAQGTAIAKAPIDYSEFDSVTVQAGIAVYGSLAAAQGAAPGASSWLNIYDANKNIKYSVAKFSLSGALATPGLDNIGAAANDFVYMVYDGDGAQIIGFVTTNKAYKGMVKAEINAAGVAIDLLPVQYNSDAGGKYVYTRPGVGTIVAGTEAISKSDLQAVMDFFSFSFGNNYPILAKHFEAYAGLWQILEAKYNVAAAVISNPDPGVDIVPKTGDASTAFGMIMVAIAGLATVGFVMMKRVRG